MAKPDDPPPPFGRKQQQELIAHDWHKPISDFPEITQTALRKKNKRAGKASGEKRRKEPSPNPITDFIKKKLNRDPDISGRAMVAALKAVAENGLADGSIIMSDDGKAFVVMDNGKVKNLLAMTSVPATISRLRK
jgi:hypothetical protein